MHKQEPLSQLRGVPFVKMTGSGNDFVFFDGRVVDLALVKLPQVIQAICHRNNGIGADGVVVLEPLGTSGQTTDVDHATRSAVRINYFNSDGTAADLCGNATLCSTTMAIELGFGLASGMGLDTPIGQIQSRISLGQPAIDLQPITHWQLDVHIALSLGERRVGFAVAGIPHLVLLCDDAETVDLPTRGPLLRWHSAAGGSGANVNWVSPLPDGRWRYRTFERGVEGETLACGTGAVATAILLKLWGLADSHVEIVTSSRRTLSVTLTENGAEFLPTLSGEGRVVFRGEIGDFVS